MPSTLLYPAVNSILEAGCRPSDERVILPSLSRFWVKTVSRRTFYRCRSAQVVQGSGVVDGFSYHGRSICLCQDSGSRCIRIWTEENQRAERVFLRTQASGQVGAMPSHCRTMRRERSFGASVAIVQAAGRHGTQYCSSRFKGSFELYGAENERASTMGTLQRGSLVSRCSIRGRKKG